jgi:hypothetical protein
VPWEAHSFVFLYTGDVRVGFVLFGQREQRLSRDKDTAWCAGGLVLGMIMGV